MTHAVLLALLVIPALPAHAASYCDGYAYLTRGTQLLRFDPGTGTAAVVHELPSHVNALAIHAGELYAIARPGARPVKITLDGAMAELGPIRGGPPGGFSGSFLGTSWAGSWLLLHEDRVYAVTIDGLQVTSEAGLSAPVRMGDWAFDAGGRLLSLSTDGPQASLVQIDPVTGAVEMLGHPAGLPSDSLFGAVWILGGRLYGWHHTSGVVYRVDPANPDVATVVMTGMIGDGVDAAACEPPASSPGPPPVAAPAPLAVAPGVTIATPDLVSPSRAPPGGTITVTVPTREPGRPPQPSPADLALADLSRVPDKEKPIRRWIAAGAGVMTLILLLAARGRAIRGRG